MDVSPERRAVWDRHNFTVERLLPDGQWTDELSASMGRALRFRAACMCGWRGRDLVVDNGTGREDDADRERAYDDWDRSHVPDYDLRSAGAPDRE